MWTKLVQFLYANQILSSSFIVMSFGGIVAWVVAYGRKIPADAKRWLQRRFMVVVDVANDDPIFNWISLWLNEQEYSKRVRILSATVESEEGRRSDQPSPASLSENVPDLPQILLTPAPGNHIFWYKGGLLWLERNRKDDAAPSAGGSSGTDGFMSLMSRWRRETYTLRMIGRSQTRARMLLEDARTVAVSRRRKEKKVELFVGNGGWWQSLGERDTRPLSSVFLPAGTSQGIVDDVNAFLVSKDWYVARGIPWRRGFLFHGSPGSGKTSLISALAGHFKMNLYLLSVSSARISDDDIVALFSNIPQRSIVLLEDIDAAFEQRKKSQDVQNRLSFSGLLNALDGAASKDGSVIFMTTNHRERLDEALIRPGRADVHIEFGHAVAEQADGMYRAFFPNSKGSDGFGLEVERRKLTMAEVQAHLLLYRDSPVKALNMVERVA